MSGGGAKLRTKSSEAVLFSAAGGSDASGATGAPKIAVGLDTLDGNGFVDANGLADGVGKGEDEGYGVTDVMAGVAAGVLPAGAAIEGGTASGEVASSDGMLDMDAGAVVFPLKAKEPPGDLLPTLGISIFKISGDGAVSTLL